ncbi:MAG: TraM recognition domain-containing protein, partial [Euryarchaeota archaeon]|nr:TraM recognition domain-containing protein [Euryarchaeota archaeon]
MIQNFLKSITETDSETHADTATGTDTDSPAETTSNEETETDTPELTPEERIARRFGPQIGGRDDPRTPVTINGKEWMIERYDRIEEEMENYAGAWPRAMIENARYVPDQPLWIGVSEKSGREVPVEFERLFRHVFYGGSTGSGKTTRMYNDAIALMYGGHGICIIDPKGDDIYDLLRKVPKGRWDDVIYVAPGDDYLDRTVGFNLFETAHDPDEPGFDEEIEGIVDDFKQLIKAGDFWGNRMDRVMKTMVRGMIRHPREFTPIEMYYALLDEQNRHEYADLIGAEIEDDDILFVEGYTRRIAEDLSDQDLDALIGRLNDWVQNPMTRQIIAQRESNVSIADAVNEGKIIIVKNNLPDEAKIMVATAIMRRVWTCVSDRVSGSERRVRELAGVDDPGVGYDPYFMMIDECHTVLTGASKVETILSEARSKRLGLMLATQYLHRLDDETQQAILQNCNTLLALTTLLPDEAKVLAKRFGGADADDMTTIPDYHARTKLSSEDDPFLARLTPPYPPLHSVEDAFELIQQSTDTYGVERQSGREILDEMFFADTPGSQAAEIVGAGDAQTVVETADDEAMDVEETETARTALKAVYDTSIRYGDRGGAIPNEDAHEAIATATGTAPSQAANLIERLVGVGALDRQRDDDTMRVRVTHDGRGVIGLETGSGGSGGTDEHRYLLRRVYEWGTRFGYEMDLPTQDGDELPDAVGEVPPDILPPSGLTDLSEEERARILQSRLSEEYPAIAALSGTGTLYLEAESKGLTKPGGPIKNAAKAPGPAQLLFVVADGGSDGFATNAQRLTTIFGGEEKAAYTSSQVPSDAARKFYTRRRHIARPNEDPEEYAMIEGDVRTEWIETDDGEIVCRERGGDEVFVRFADIDAYRARTPVDYPAVSYYDVELEGFVVERDGEVERKYGGKTPLQEHWSYIYDPLIPAVLFGDHGTGSEAIPAPEEWRIAIVPNDNRSMDEELVMYDPESGDLVSVETWCDPDRDETVSIDSDADLRGEIDEEDETESGETATARGDSEGAATPREPSEEQQPPPDEHPDAAAECAPLIPSDESE